MAVGILTGGRSFFRNVSEGSERLNNQGVFGNHPGATPKYALNQGGRRSERTESMARLFVYVPSVLMDKYLASLPPDSRPLGRVLASGGESQGGGGTGFVDFLLTRANESFKEKAQIVDTLTDNYVAFYSGQQPLLFRYSGTVLNTYQDEQRIWLLRLYRDILRGTRLAGRNLVANLRYDSFIVSGYLESLQLGLIGDTEVGGSFTFTLRVKEMRVWTPQFVNPSTLRSSNTSGLVSDQTSEEVDDSDARVATVTPEKPSDASSSPAADQESKEEDLREQQFMAAGDGGAKFKERISALNTDAVVDDGFLGSTNIRGTSEIEAPPGAVESGDQLASSTESPSIIGALTGDPASLRAAGTIFAEQTVLLKRLVKRTRGARK